MFFIVLYTLFHYLFRVFWPKYIILVHFSQDAHIINACAYTARTSLLLPHSWMAIQLEQKFILIASLLQCVWEKCFLLTSSLLPVCFPPLVDKVSFLSHSFCNLSCINLLQAICVDLLFSTIEAASIGKFCSFQFLRSFGYCHLDTEPFHCLLLSLGALAQAHWASIVHTPPSPLF